MRLVSVALVVLPAAIGCTLTADPPAQPQPDPLGTGVRIASIQNPDSPDYRLALANSAGVDVNVSSAVVSWIDTFDETMDGKSIGTVYVQDVGSTAPYAGIDLYEPSYVPASLRLFPGDVLDLVGPYEEGTSIGTAVFTNGTLPQLAKPVGTFRYPFQTPTPVTIQLSDIDQLNYATGRKWENMLVTINDVHVLAGMVDTSGKRVTYQLAQGSTPPDGSAATLANELYDLKATDYTSGTHFASVTGIVTWFFSYQLAPRSAADLVLADAGP